MLVPIRLDSAHSPSSVLRKPQIISHPSSHRIQPSRPTIPGSSASEPGPELLAVLRYLSAAVALPEYRPEALKLCFAFIAIPKYYRLPRRGSVRAVPHSVVLNRTAARTTTTRFTSVFEPAQPTADFT